MCKTANVILIGKEYLLNGYGRRSCPWRCWFREKPQPKPVLLPPARRVGELISVHVIPRPFDETEKILKSWSGGKKGTDSTPRIARSNVMDKDLESVQEARNLVTASAQSLPAIRNISLKNRSNGYSRKYRMPELPVRKALARMAHEETGVRPAPNTKR